MRRNLARWFILTILIVVLSGFTLTYANEIYNGMDMVITEEQLMEGDYIRASNRIINKGKITGDFIVAANEINHQGIIEGDLIAAASEIGLLGIVNGDIRVIAANILIEGEVSKNASMVGSRIVQYKDSIIDGSIHAFSSNLDIRGYIGGDISGANQNTIISGTVKGNIYVYTESIKLLPDAIIEGNLTYVSEAPQNINPQQVRGKIEHRYPTVSSRRDFANQIQSAIKKASIFSKIIFMLSYLIAGILLIWAFKRPYERASDVIQERPWYSIGLGVSILICVPIVAVILLITIIGIPFSLIGMALYGILLYTAKIPLGIWLGSKILRGEKRLTIWFIIGTLILEAVSLIPYAGWLISFGTLSIGIGATIIMIKRYYKNEYVNKGTIPPVH